MVVDGPSQQVTFEVVGRRNGTIYAPYMDKQLEMFESKEKAKKEKSETSKQTQAPTAPRSQCFRANEKELLPAPFCHGS